MPTKYSEAEILAIVTDIMRDFFDEDDLQITMATTAKEVDGWDSMNHVNIVIAVEQKFGIRFLTAEVENLQNVGELVHLVEAKLNKA